MHSYITHTRCQSTVRKISDAILAFLHNAVPWSRHRYCDEVTDNFRIISSTDVRVLA